MVASRRTRAAWCARLACAGGAAAEERSHRYGDPFVQVTKA